GQTGVMPAAGPAGAFAGFGPGAGFPAGQAGANPGAGPGAAQRGFRGPRPDGGGLAAPPGGIAPQDADLAPPTGSGRFDNSSATPPDVDRLPCLGAGGGPAGPPPLNPGGNGPGGPPFGPGGRGAVSEQLRQYLVAN